MFKRNDYQRIKKGIHQRIIAAIKRDQQWKWRLLNDWRMDLLEGK